MEDLLQHPFSVERSHPDPFRATCSPRSPRPAVCPDHVASQEASPTHPVQPEGAQRFDLTIVEPSHSGQVTLPTVPNPVNGPEEAAELCLDSQLESHPPVTVPTIQLEAVTDAFYQFSCPLRVSLTPTPDFLAAFYTRLSSQGIRITNYGQLTEFLIAERVRLRTTPLPSLLQDRARYLLKAKDEIFFLVSRNLTAFDLFSKRVLQKLRAGKVPIKVLNDLAQTYWEDRERPTVSFRPTTDRRRKERQTALSISNSFTLFVQAPVSRPAASVDLRETVSERQRRIQKEKYFLGPPFGARPKNTKIKFPPLRSSGAGEVDSGESVAPAGPAAYRKLSEFVKFTDFGRTFTEGMSATEQPHLTLAVPRSRYFASSSLLNPAQQESLSFHLKKVGMEGCRLVYSSVSGKWTDPHRLQDPAAWSEPQEGKEMLIVARQGEILAGGFNLTCHPLGMVYTFRLDTECIHIGENRRVAIQKRPSTRGQLADPATCPPHALPRRMSEGVGALAEQVALYPVGFDYEGKFSKEVLEWDAFEVFEVSLAEN